MLKVGSDECDALLQILWEDSITGLALVNADGSFRRANPSFCRIVEYSEAELKRLRFQDITDPSDTQADEEMARMVAAGEYPGYDMTKSYITKTKRLQPVLLRVTGLKINGQFTYFVGEIAPLDSPPAERAISGTKTRKIPLKAIRENWQIIALVASALAYLASQTLLYVKNPPNALNSPPAHHEAER